MKRMTSFVIEKEVLTQLDGIAKADGKSRSQVLREAVAGFVNTQLDNSLALLTDNPNDAG